MNLFIFLFFMLIAVGQAHAVRYTPLVNAVVNECSKELLRSNKLSLVGRGTNGPADVKAISAHYVMTVKDQERVDVEHARRIYLKILNEYIKRTNANKEIRPLLHNYPFNELNFEISLSFEDSAGNRINPDNIAFMFNGKGVIYYEKYDINSKPDPFIEVHKETYAEAMQILNTPKI